MSTLLRSCAVFAVLAAHLGAQVVTPVGSIDWANPIGWSSGHVPLGTDAPLISAGTITVSNPASIGSIAFTGGVINGAATLTLSGSGSTWQGGDFAGTGTTAIGTGATLTLSGAADKRLYHGNNGAGGRTLDNAGTITWTGAGQILLGDGAQILNRAGATFALQNDSTVGYAGFGNGGAFTNSGTLRKSTATGTSTLALPFATTGGLVEAQSGTIAFTSTVTSNGTEFRTSTGGAIHFSGGQTFNTGTSFTGSGLNKITAGTSVFDGTIATANLEFAGGVAVGTAALSGAMQWTGGAWAGDGTFTLTSGTLTLSGAATKELYHGSNGANGRKLENVSTVLWTDAGNILLGDGAQLLNRTGGTFNAQNNATIGYIGFGNAGSFTNAGSFVKSGATGTTTLALAFTNNGLVDAQTGTLAFTSPVNGNGEFRTTTGTSNVFSSDKAFASGTRFTGSGQNRITTGSTTFDGTVSSTNLEFAGGTATGTATLTGNVAWTAGAWAGPGTFTFTAGTLTIDGAANKEIYHGSNGSGGRTVSIGGAALWTGTGPLLGGDGAGIQVQSGGSFDIRNDSTYGYIGFGGAPFFSNAGTLRKSAGAGTTTFANVALANTGSILLQAGRLDLSGTSAGLSNNGLLDVSSGASFTQSAGGGASAGTFNVASGGTLRFTGGTQTLNTGATFTGAGVSEIAGATLIVAGAATIGTPTAAGTVRLASGALGGGATATVNTGSAFRWSGGDLHGTGTLLVSTGASLLIDGDGPKNLYHGSNGAGGHVISNFGTTTWQGLGNILGGDGASIINQTGGLFEVQNDSSLGYVGFGNGLTFTNAGTFRKTAGAGVTALNQVFNNSGTVEATTGRIAIAAGGSSNGVFRATGTGLIDFTGGYLLTGGNIVGAAGARVSSGLTISGPTAIGSATETGLLTLVSGGSIGGGGTLSLHPASSLVWTGGDMHGTGTTAIMAGSELVLSGAATKNFYHGSNGAGGRILSNGGTIRWTGTGSLLGGDGARIDNLAGGVFDAQADATLGYIGFGNSITFTNTGLFRKSASAGSFVFSAGTFNNPGNVTVESGTLALNSGGSSVGGQFNVSNGATLAFGADYAFDGATLSGPGHVNFAGRTLVFSGATSTVAGVLDLAKNSGLTGSGVLSVTGTLNWTGGAMHSTGVTRIASSGQLLLSGGDDKALYHGSNGAGGRTLENFGLVAMSGAGALLLGDGATIGNNSGGTIDLRGDSSLGYLGFGNGGTLNNSGLLQKSSGSGTATIGGLTLLNQATGRIWAQSGTIAVTAPLTNSGGTFEAASGATIRFDDNVGRTFDTHSNFAGTGPKLITAGSTSFNGDFTAQNLSFTGGALHGPAALHGTMSWTGGDWVGPNVFTVANAAVLTLDGPSAKYLYHGSNGAGGRTLANSGVLIWQGSGQILLGDGAQITNASGALVDVRSDSTIGYAGFGNGGAITNDGIFSKSAGTGTTTVAQPFAQSSTGIVAVSSGTLAFASTFTNNGGSVITHGGNLSFSAPVNLGTGSLLGFGTVTAPGVTTGGVIAPGASIGTLTVAGNLTLLSTSQLLIELGGANQGSGYDFLNVTGTAAIDGRLGVTFTNGFETAVSSTDTFTILSAGTRTGTFVNAPTSGVRLTTFDGLGTFQVNFTANSVTLSQFTAVPEPSTYALLGLGLVVVFGSVRRRRKTKK